MQRVNGYDVGARLVARESSTANDAATVQTLRRATSGTAASGIACRQMFQCENAAGEATDAASIDGILTTTTDGAETSALALAVRSAGGAMTERARLNGVGSFVVGSTLDPAAAGYGIGSGLQFWGLRPGSTWRSILNNRSDATAINVGNSSDLFSFLGFDIRMAPGGSERARYWASGAFVIGHTSDPGAVCASVNGFVEFKSVADPANPGAGDGRLYARASTVTLGKIDLVIRWPGGTETILATSP